MGEFKVEPSNEVQVREYFAAHISESRYSIVESGLGFPDYVLADEEGRRYRVEAEYESANFVMHGHDPLECDFVICWKHTQVLPLPVLELSTNTMHIRNAEPTHPRTYPHSTVDVKAERFAQALHEKVNAQPDNLAKFYEAIAADMRAQSKYQSLLTAPRLELLKATLALLRSVDEENMNPYDLLKVLSS